MKHCIICKIEQPLEQYYKHAQMGDGHLNKCKTCCKAQAKEREEKLRQNPEWKETEKARHREKYYRLEYKEKHKRTPEQKKLIMKRYYEKYPEKESVKKIITSLRRKFKVEKGIELHHWSYNKNHWKDVILLSIKDHNFLHRFLNYDQNTLMYKTKEGELLDTKEKHINYYNYLKENFE